MLKLRQVQYSYSQDTSISYPDMDLALGENLLLQGASGTGKSTLLHLLMGLLEVQGEGLSLFDRDFNRFKTSDLIALRKEQIGFMAQRPLFVKSLSIAENIALAKWAGAEEDASLSVLERAEMLGVAACMHKYPEELSLGQLQRCQLIKCLAYKYKLLLLDEPSASLDDDNIDKVAELLQLSLADKNRSIIIVSHDPRLTAWGISKKLTL